MEVAIHPDYAKNGWIYLAYTEPGKDRGGLTKIVRGKLEGTKWTAQQTIFEADQKFYTGAGVHFGSRIAFDGKGKVFFAIGERGGNMLAQELTNPFGKVYRLNDDGSEPKDNPFVGQEGVIKGIWTYGHRNPQGLAFDLDGNLWDTEHGPRGGDEVNRIDKGGNYGWPVVAWSINYNDAPFRTPWPKDDLKVNQPAFRWLPSIGACGLDVVRGSAFPQWKGDLVAGGLSGANVDRLRMKDGKLVEREELVHGMGRVREVAVGPDGNVYIALNQPDKVIRLVPAK
jgi:glucose/arabinose dehydrogenase